MTSYAIKPLEWVDLGAFWCAKTILGDYGAWNSWMGGSFWSGPGDTSTKIAPSLEAAKAAAEAHYRERILTALEAVK